MRSMCRRCVHTLTDPVRTREQLRQLLRDTAQSVAVVTVRRHRPGPPSYHGATLSSFTSIALDPSPLVAFSLRVPSRMASALHAHVASRLTAPHLIINILSAAQPHLADRFARPDRHPRPFEDPAVLWSLSRDGLPMLSGALGALSCALVGPSLPLAHMCGRGNVKGPLGEGEGGEEKEALQASAGTGLASELFIARVLRVERVPPPVDGEQDEGRLHTLPLVYHQRRFTTVRER